MLDEKTHKVALNKRLSRDLAESLGIRVSQGSTVKTLDQAIACSEEFGFPLVAKPLTSVDENMVTNICRVRRLDSVHDLHDFYDNYAGSFVLEKFFVGAGCGIEFLANNGVLKFAFQHERIHEFRDTGGSSYRRSVPLDPDLLAAARTLTDAMSYTGVGMIEFRKNKNTGEFIFVEINGRFWGALPLAVSCGANFP